MPKATRACLDCGEDISHRHHNARRCFDCAPLAAARAWAEDKPRKRACAVDDHECTPGRLRRDVCPLHYSRLKSRGVTTPPEPGPDHFARYTVLDNGCWRWDGPLHATGYGHSPASTGDGNAHRAFYAHYVGPIPDGATIDHLCHNRDTACRGGDTCPHRRCVNPEHLEPASQGDNNRRAHSTRDLCRNGLHDLTLPGARREGLGCVQCWRARYAPAVKRYQARRRGDPNAEPRRRPPMGPHTPRRLDDRPMTRNRVIRAWARAQGMDVKVKAMIPRDAQRAFDALIERVSSP